MGRGTDFVCQRVTARTPTISSPVDHRVHRYQRSRVRLGYPYTSGSLDVKKRTQTTENLKIVKVGEENPEDLPLQTVLEGSPGL